MTRSTCPASVRSTTRALRAASPAPGRVAFALALAVVLSATPSATAAAAQHGDDMQRIGAFAIDRTEVTVGVFRRFADATGLVTRAERDGGGLVYIGFRCARDAR